MTMSRQCALLLIFLLTAAAVQPAHADLSSEGLSGLYRSPEPFSVNEYDVVQALWLLRRARLLIQLGPNGERTIVPVRNVEAVTAVYIGTDPEAPGPQHEDRYDIILNGDPLDWANTYIRYNNRMVNLQALFTYRNQLPESGLPLYLDP
jgi:hypothetical protein